MRDCHRRWTDRCWRPSHPGSSAKYMRGSGRPASMLGAMPAPIWAEAGEIDLHPLRSGCCTHLDNIRRHRTAAHALCHRYVIVAADIAARGEALVEIGRRADFRDSETWRSAGSTIAPLGLRDRGLDIRSCECERGHRIGAHRAARGMAPNPAVDHRALQGRPAAHGGFLDRQELRTTDTHARLNPSRA